MTSNAVVPTNTAGVEPYIQDQPHIHYMKNVATYRRVIQYCPNVAILHLVERIDGLDTVIEQFMEHEADTRSSTELVQRQIVRVSVDDGAELGRELGNDVQHDARRVVLAEGAAELLQFSLIFLQLERDPLLNVGERCSDMVHQDLIFWDIRCVFSCSIHNRRTMLSLRARNGVPQNCAFPL